MIKIKYFILPFLLTIVIFAISLSGNFFDNKYTVNKRIDLKTFDANDNKFLLVYFGYLECIDVCSPRLIEISDIYKKLINNKIDINTIFINISSKKDEKLLDEFGKSFNNNFKSVYLEKKNVEKIKKIFAAQWKKSMIDNISYSHTSFLYLLKKTNNEYYLKRIYAYAPFSVKEITKDVIYENTIK